MVRYIANHLPDFEPGAEGATFDRSVTLARIEKGVKGILQHYPPAGHDASVYTGLLGVAFLFWKLHSLGIGNGTSLPHAEKYLAAAAESYDQQRQQSQQRITLLEGEAGLYAIGAAVAAASHDEGSARRLSSRLVALQPLATSDKYPYELLYGTAGYLSSLLFVRSLPLMAAGHAHAAAATAAAAAAAAIPDESIRRCVDHLVSAGAAGAAAAGTAAGLPPSALMYSWHGSRYLGGAHGVAGIALTLLQALEVLYGGGGGGGGPAGGAYDALLDAVRGGRLPPNDREAFERAMATLHYLSGLQLPSGNFPSRPESQRDELVQWCHGAPGVVPALAMGHAVVGRGGGRMGEDLLRAAEAGAEDIWRRGLLAKGNGLCHGVAGNAYAFLSLWRVTRDPKHLHRAARFADFAASEAAAQQQSTPDRPYSLFEGLAGAICLHADLLDPERSRFPCVEF